MEDGWTVLFVGRFGVGICWRVVCVLMFGYLGGGGGGRGRGLLKFFWWDVGWGEDSCAGGAEGAVGA